jgi:hypothetical protein
MPAPFSMPQFNELPGEYGADFESELVARLKADVSLQELVGSRIYPLVMPEKAARPALVYAVTGTRRDRNLAGPAGMAYATVHLDVRADRYADAKRGQEILRQYDGASGPLTRSVRVIRAWLDDQADAYEWPEDASARGTHHLTLTFQFKYRESIPVAP